MKSQTRIDCENSVKSYADFINNTLKTGNLMYVGIAGDPPGGEYAPFFMNFNIITADADPVWGAEIKVDISSEKIDKYKEFFDVIVCTQVIEHIPNFWNVPEVLHYYMKSNGYLIIDCPFMYKYHAEPPSFGDYWRITKDGFRHIFQDKKFKILSIIDTNNNTSCLIQKI
jgi:hypothetical protein